VVAQVICVAGAHGSIIDLTRDRDDGYDLTDWLNDHHRNWPPERIRAALGYRGTKAAVRV
jgi:hypothetical protein